jgi:MFS transporter, DHA3 family, macrolide efflux protein
VGVRGSWLRTFLIIFTGQAFSLLGSSAVNFALVWWLTVETGSASLLAYASIAAILPQALLGPVAGPFIDRWDRRKTMMGADLFIAATSVALIGVFVWGRPSVAVIIGALAARSIGTAFHTPASQAAVPMYVPAEHLMQVAGWNFFLGSGVAMAGPVIGAFLMGVAPMTAVIAVDVAGAVIAVSALALVRIPHPERSEAIAARSGLVAEFLEGWHELARRRGLLALTLVLTVVTLLYMPLNALFPLMTLSHFGGSAFSASMTELAFGAGMLLGSLVIGVLSARFSAVGLIGTGILTVGVMIGASGLLPSTAFWAFVTFCAVMGVSVPLFGAPINAMFQTLIDPAKLGRVMALYMTIAMLVAPVGLVLAGPLAERTGVAVWFAISGLLIFLAGLLVWAVPPVRRLGDEMRAVAARAAIAGAATAGTATESPAAGESVVAQPPALSTEE